MCLSAKEKLLSDFKVNLAATLPKALPISSLDEVIKNFQKKTTGEVSQQILSIKVK